jgi:tetratricopeptide (TPR) repeat protein
MATSVLHPRPFRRLAAVPFALVAITLCGCSINLGSLSSSSGDEAPPVAPAGAALADAQAHNIHGQTLARAGKNDQALAEFVQAIAIDPNNADALYNRGLLYQGNKQHQFAIDDFTAATRGLAYERLGDRTKAAGSYGRALSLRPKDETAQNGFGRVGGRPGQSYDAF